jgi:D-apiose dehydrogenase
MDSKRLRGTLIGCGFFAENHLHAWRDIEGVDIVAVCDLDGARAAAVAARFGVPRHYADAAAMLDAERPDFVDVATNVNAHRAMVELAAARGVGVICQKPMAASLGDARAMVSACERAGVPLMVHENFRWQQPILAVAEVLRSGRIGTPFFGRVSFRHDYDVYRTQPYLAQIERFAIMDVGVHLVDVARFLFGEVTRLSCTVRSVNPAVEGEDVATMLLEHAGGASAVVDCSFYSHLDPNPFPDTLVEVDGTAGSVRLGLHRALQVTDRAGTTHTVADAPTGGWLTPPWHVVQQSVRNIQQHWVDCLRQGRTPDTSGADNLRTLAVCLAAYESAEQGRTIHFG